LSTLRSPLSPGVESVPYTLSPLFATLTKTAGVPVSSHFGSIYFRGFASHATARGSMTSLAAPDMALFSPLAAPLSYTLRGAYLTHECSPHHFSRIDPGMGDLPLVADISQNSRTGLAEPRSNRGCRTRCFVGFNDDGLWRLGRNERKWILRPLAVHLGCYRWILCGAVWISNKPPRKREVEMASLRSFCPDDSFLANCRVGCVMIRRTIGKE